MNPIAQIKFGRTWYNNLKVSEMILNQLENFPEEGHLLCHREIFKETFKLRLDRLIEAREHYKTKLSFVL